MMLDVPGAKQHTMGDGGGTEIRVRQLRTWVLLAHPPHGFLELGSSLPEKGDPVLLIGRRIGGM